MNASNDEPMPVTERPRRTVSTVTTSAKIHATTRAPAVSTRVGTSWAPITEVTGRYCVYDVPRSPLKKPPT